MGKDVGKSNSDIIRARHNMGIFVLWPKVETSMEFFVENYLKLCYDQILKVSTASVFGNFLLKIGTDGVILVFRKLHPLPLPQLKYRMRQNLNWP